MRLFTKGAVNKEAVTKRELLDRLDRVNEWTGKIVSFLILVLIGILMFEMVSRYVFNSPTIWVHDLSGYLQFTYVILGGGYTLLHGRHVRVDILYGRFSPKTQVLLDLTIASFLFFSLMGLALWHGTGFALKSVMMQETSVSGMWRGPAYPFKIFLPIGVILIMFQWVLMLIRKIGDVKWKSNRE